MCWSFLEFRKRNWLDVIVAVSHKEADPTSFRKNPKATDIPLNNMVGLSPRANLIVIALNAKGRTHPASIQWLCIELSSKCLSSAAFKAQATWELTDLAMASKGDVELEYGISRVSRLSHTSAPSHWSRTTLDTGGTIFGPS